MLKFITITLLCSLFISNKTYTQNFQNPDLEGSISNLSNLPPNWSNVTANDPVCLATIIGNQDSPDLVSQTLPDAPQGIIGSPYSGSTFVSGVIAMIGINWPTPQYYHEGIKQTVSGFIIGEKYTISFYQSVVQQYNCRDKSGSWSIYSNNTLLGITTPTVSTGNFDDINLNWEYREINFIATSPSLTFKFLPTDDDLDLNNQAIDYSECLRMGIDKINISPCLVPDFNLGNDTLLCLDNQITLTSELTGDVTYLWQDNSTLPSLNVTQPGEYSLEVSNSCGSYSDTIIITYYNCKPEISLPNVFTPNGDQVNDYFQPIIIENIKEVKIIILNRWGQVVFESNKLDFIWSGKSYAEGVYFWKIEYIDYSDTQGVLSGTVSLCK